MKKFNINKTINLRNGVVLEYRKFTLGSLYAIGKRNPSVCKFIKVTPKGYNFLNIETSKCIFRRHFYVPKKAQHLVSDNTQEIIITMATDFYFIHPFEESKAG